MAHFPSSAPALTHAAPAIPSLPSRGDLRSGLAAWMAEAAVLLVRGSAAGILLSPLVLAGFLIVG